MLRIKLARLEERIAALDRLTDEKFVTISAMMKFQADKVELALAASDKADDKATLAYEKRFESVNEFRDTLSDQAANLVGRNEYNATVKALTDKLAVITERLDKSEGKGVGLNAGWIYLIGAITVMGVLITILLQ